MWYESHIYQYQFKAAIHLPLYARPFNVMVIFWKDFALEVRDHATLEALRRLEKKEADVQHVLA
jgi:hypothetical protein